MYRQVDFVKEYWTEVFVPFLDAYQTGVETPNPDAFCNRFVKFNHFRKYVTNKLGIDTIATGHYSCMVDSSSTEVKNGIMGAEGSADSGVQMLKGRDPLKDQSYFLALTKVSLYCTDWYNAVLCRRNFIKLSLFEYA